MNIIELETQFLTEHPEMQELRRTFDYDDEIKYLSEYNEWLEIKLINILNNGRNLNA